MLVLIFPKILHAPIVIEKVIPDFVVGGGGGFSETVWMKGV